MQEISSCRWPYGSPVLSWDSNGVPAHSMGPPTTLRLGPATGACCAATNACIEPASRIAVRNAFFIHPRPRRLRAVLCGAEVSDIHDEQRTGDEQRTNTCDRASDSRAACKREAGQSDFRIVKKSAALSLMSAQVTSENRC